MRTFFVPLCARPSVTVKQTTARENSKTTSKANLNFFNSAPPASLDERLSKASILLTPVLEFFQAQPLQRVHIGSAGLFMPS